MGKLSEDTVGSIVWGTLLMTFVIGIIVIAFDEALHRLYEWNVFIGTVVFMLIIVFVSVITIASSE